MEYVVVPHTSSRRVISPTIRHKSERMNVARRHLLEMRDPQQARKERVSVTRPAASKKYDTIENSYHIVSK